MSPNHYVSPGNLASQKHVFYVALPGTMFYEIRQSFFLKSRHQFFLTLLLVFAVNGLRAQTGFGVDVGYAASNAVNMNLKYYFKQHVLSAGGTYQFNDARGKKVKEQRTGFGRTVTGDGDYFYTIDIGYAYRLKPHFLVGGELSFGEKSFYTEYADNRFTGGGYHMVNRSRFLFGAGVIQPMR
ncbi:MAG: hypothetical protein EOO04_16275 [Chitinophagaceae bacterium]|nr:MAG: hypothetical protein EOO04_16275 [Chitinophagaceae bacterium]